MQTEERLNLVASRLGYIELSIKVGTEIRKGLFNNVLYVSALRFSLLSVEKFVESGTEAIFTNTTARLLLKNKIVAPGSKKIYTTLLTSFHSKTHTNSWNVLQILTYDINF